MPIANLSGVASVVGVGNSKYGRHMPETALTLGLQGFKAALDDAGLKKEQIDGLVINNQPRFPYFAATARLNVKWASAVWTHGRMSVNAILNCVFALNAGMCNTVAVMNCFGVPQNQEPFRPDHIAPNSEEGQEGGWRGAHSDVPHMGATTPIYEAAILTRNYMHKYGMTSPELAAVAVSARKFASMNPNAAMRKPITVQDHQDSRYVIEPLHLLDCSIPIEGGTCLILQRTEDAQKGKKMPVKVVGFQGIQAGRNDMMWGRPGLGLNQEAISEYQTTDWDLASYKMAGISRSDISALYCYDPFTISPICVLERFGFAKPGEGYKFVQNGATGPGGKLPMNTHGGSMSEGHMEAFNHFAEMVRQVRGECGERQQNVRYAQYANGWGDSLILGK